MTCHGKVQDGVIVREPGATLPEGARVRIEVRWPVRDEIAGTADPLLRMTDFATVTGISDLATHIDHYPVGHPKVDEPG